MTTNTDWEKRMKYTTIACPMCGVSLDFIRQLLLTERKKWVEEFISWCDEQGYEGLQKEFLDTFEKKK